MSCIHPAVDHHKLWTVTQVSQDTLICINSLLDDRQISGGDDLMT